MSDLTEMFERDFIEHYGVHECSLLVYEDVTDRDFDVDDVTRPFVVPFKEGKASFTHVTDNNEVVEVAKYEDFIDGCVRPASFKQGRRKCDFLMHDLDSDCFFILLEITSALGNITNLRKPIFKRKSGEVEFEYGKFQKCELQLLATLKDLMEVAQIKEYFFTKIHRVCLMAYRIDPYKDPNYFKKHPFARYLNIESSETGENGAVLSSPAINALGFEYRRINHNNVFDLSFSRI